MAYAVSVGIHGVAKIGVSMVSTHESTGKKWQSVTLWFYDQEGAVLDMIQVHSENNQTLKVYNEHEL